MKPHVIVVGCGADGWFSRYLPLAAYARARAQLERLDILFVHVGGDLA